MRPNKLLYVDSMRGWAILMVIACHQAQAFHHLTRPIKLFASYGQTGVFLFFVASAFTLSNSATMRLEEAHPIRSFFIRRYFRIAPLYYLGIGFYAALAALLPQYTAGWLSDISPLSLVTNLAFVHGLVPDAFGGAVPGGWSISTEWMFYVLFPVLFAVCRKAVSAWGWRVLIVPVLLMSVISFATVFKMTAGIENEIFYFWYCSLLTQLPVFLLGITLFMAVQSGSLPPNLKWDVPLFVITSAAALWMLEARWMLLLPLLKVVDLLLRLQVNPLKLKNQPRNQPKKKKLFRLPLLLHKMAGSRPLRLLKNWLLKKELISKVFPDLVMADASLNRMLIIINPLKLPHKPELHQKQVHLLHLQDRLALMKCLFHKCAK